MLRTIWGDAEGRDRLVEVAQRRLLPRRWREARRGRLLLASSAASTTWWTSRALGPRRPRRGGGIRIRRNHRRAQRNGDRRVRDPEGEEALFFRSRSARRVSRPRREEDRRGQLLLIGDLPRTRSGVSGAGSCATSRRDAFWATRRRSRALPSSTPSRCRSFKPARAELLPAGTRTPPPLPAGGASCLPRPRASTPR